LLTAIPTTITSLAPTSSNYSSLNETNPSGGANPKGDENQGKPASFGEGIGIGVVLIVGAVAGAWVYVQKRRKRKDSVQDGFQFTEMPQ
jgi:hypothetical protein